MLVLGLQLAGLVPGVGLEAAVQSELQPGHQLLVIHGGVDGVVSVPLLGQLQPVVLARHLGLQAAADLAAVGGGVAAGRELEPAGGLALDLELDQAEVVTLAEHIPGALADIGV